MKMTWKVMLMARTDELRACVRSVLKTIPEIKEVYYEVADKDAMYPHAVLTFSSVDLGDFNRHDIMVDVDLWDHGTESSTIEGICDQIEDLFNNLNAPSDEILPTFFTESKRSIPDEDKLIKHRLVRIQAQNYDRR